MRETRVEMHFFASWQVVGASLHVLVQLPEVHLVAMSMDTTDPWPTCRSGERRRAALSLGG